MLKGSVSKLAGLVGHQTFCCVRRTQALGDGKRRQSRAREAQTDRTEKVTMAGIDPSRCNGGLSPNGRFCDTSSRPSVYGRRVCLRNRWKKQREYRRARQGYKDLLRADRQDRGRRVLQGGVSSS